MDAYTQKIRERNEERLQATGRRPTMFVRTYGCQMNVRESEHLTGMLVAMGYDAAEGEAEADLVVYNTCSVRENAENKVFGHLGYLKYHKANRPGMVIALCGCMAQRDEVISKIKTSYRHVDMVFGTANRRQFPRLLYTCLETGQPVFDTDSTPDLSPEVIAPADTTVLTRAHKYKAGVNIMYGCDNFCAYCIVPYVRGRERSRTPEDVLAEVSALAADGVREVLLLGQNVNAYGAGTNTGFAALLRRVNAVPGIRRIRFTTSHPKDLSDSVIEAVRDCEKVCKHIHLPFQSGSTTILEKMNRRYTKADYLALTRRIRDAIPNAAISTDVIVGFPGETEADFLDTLDVVRQVRFSGVFTFIYSKRTGTPAAAMTDTVPESEAVRRLQTLVDAVNPILLARNKAREGLTEMVLAEDTAKEGHMTGRTEDNTIVHFEGAAVCPGDMVAVHVTEGKTFFMLGRLANA